MSTPDIHHLAAAYALDAVDEQERRAFEAHYHECVACRADVRDHRETLAAIAAESPVAPSASVRERMLAEIAQTRQLSPLLPDGVSDLAERRRRRRRMTTSMLAAATLVVVLAAGAVFLTTGPSQTFGDHLAAVVDQPDSHFLTLAATDAHHGPGVVRVTWSEAAGRAIVLGDDLPAAPAGTAYELWMIDERGPQPMRLLDAADHGELRGVFDIGATPTAWGVTVEPAGGSTVPTGDILFIAEI